MSEFICFGHRGAKGHAPENTVLSIETALQLGAPWIEVDVFPVEGQLVVIHDRNLERTTNGKGRVDEQPFAYLRTLDAGKGQQIPTLEEVFDVARGRAGVNVEIKHAGAVSLLAAFLRDRFASGWQIEKVIVSSFDHRALKAFKQLVPEARIGVLLYGLPLENAACAAELGAYSVHADDDFIDAELVDDAHRRGLKVYVYTVNDLDTLRRMRALGVDGVFSDYPDRVLSAL
jgi:glycerophosphoryl diester phosphodiesterase